jgi:Tc toxin complex TcA C-terminal TcB-binding domain
MNRYRKQVGFHSVHDADLQAQSAAALPRDTVFTYTFENFFHPFVGELITQLNKKSLPGMLDPVFLDQLDTTRDADKDPPNSFFKLFSEYYSQYFFPFHINSFKDFPSLAFKLKDPANRVSSYLRDQFSEDTKEQLRQYISGSPDEPLQSFLIHDLNLVINGPTIYNDQRFAQVTLSEQTRELINRNPQGELLVRLNRLLLEDAYQNEIAKSLLSDFVIAEGFPIEIDLREGGPYANYNWELLFHIPLTIAVHLSKNQRFAEAQRWFHYIFNPISNDTSISAPQRFWNFLAFRQDSDVSQIGERLALLSKPDSECTEREMQQKLLILTGYLGIKDHPFEPHRVARTRHLAYRYWVVMKYLDNLIAWGDSLFRQDTVESINEATQRYVLAANILGLRPQRIPPQSSDRPKNFRDLKAAGLDQMGNALVELEAKFPFNFGLPKTQNPNPHAAGTLFGIARTLYFCIPRNDKLLGYWDTVSDRLFKIRHCMNIEGVVRQLALFDPPIDPGMLVKAAAAGISIGSIVSGLNQPIGPMRCLFLIQKAAELAAEVRALGSAVLSAIEKGESEHLASLRQGHEIKIQQMQQEVRFLQWQQAKESSESLLRSRASVVERYRYYQRLLGLPLDPDVPDTFVLNRRELNEENFEEVHQLLVGTYQTTLKHLDPPPLTKSAGATFDENPSFLGMESTAGRLYLNAKEDAELNKHLPKARDAAWASSVVHALAASFVSIPDGTANMHFWGLGGSINLKVGTALTSIARFAGDVLGIISAWEREQAGMASRTASYERRADEWILQNNLAALELMQLGQQIITSLIAEQIAHHEYLNIQKQIEQSQEVDRFLHEKFTNEELYLWMQGELSKLYYEYYRFAFDTARKAEQTMKRELMRPEVEANDYIKFNYWDAGRKGLLSGEALYLDIKRMEMAYHENNKREYELTKHVSLRQLNPLALLTLKATGTCEVTIPEWLFDLDNPGHYLRRIKNVGLSIPSVAGPYTSVNCTLYLLKSSLRKVPTGEDYSRQGSEDDRFVDYYGTIQSIVTSTGNNDTGLFEANLRDERFLPFEGAGAESTWKLELPAGFRQFDYDTISDVVLHLRYTARQGGAPLRDRAIAHLGILMEESNHAGLTLLFSLKHDFPSELHRFNSGEDLVVKIRRDFFPYFTQGGDIELGLIELWSIKDGNPERSPQPDPALTLDDFEKLLNDPTNGVFELTFKHSDNILGSDKNAFLVISYSIKTKNQN